MKTLFEAELDDQLQILHALKPDITGKWLVLYSLRDGLITRAESEHLMRRQRQIEQGA